ncbi:MAG: DUF4932 domain-containing protein [Candidatus Dojkabacteria bacterium]|nr:DUF4932 domain-containing protein [Candidatus Dojkabacteria bacterium]
MKKYRLRISVKTNSNVIFFETLLSLLNSKDTDFHPLGNKIVTHFSDIQNLESFKEFKNKYEQGKITRHAYQYLFLSINLYSNLKPKELSPSDGFGPNRYKGYMEDIYPLVKQIYSESDFTNRYKTEILSEYKEIAKDMQSLFDRQNPSDVLIDFWGKSFEPKLIFIPDPLRIGGGSGLSRGNTFYSVTGTVNRKEKVIFDNSHMISNLLHEFSHSFFHKYLYSNREHVEINNQLTESLYKNLDETLKGEIGKQYGPPLVYFEETFIRAVQILLTKEFFSKYMPEEENSSKSLKQLKKRKEDGFIYIEEFYNELNNNNSPILSYIKVLKSLS